MPGFMIVIGLVAIGGIISFGASRLLAKLFPKMNSLLKMVISYLLTLVILIGIIFSLIASGIALDWLG
jgi:hypothetical protein